MKSSSELEWTLKEIRQRLDQIERELRGQEIFNLLTPLAVAYIGLMLNPSDIIIRLFGALVILDLIIWWIKVGRRR